MQIVWILAMFCKSPFKEYHISSLVVPLFGTLSCICMSPSTHNKIPYRFWATFQPHKIQPGPAVKKRRCLVAELGKTQGTFRYFPLLRLMEEILHQLIWRISHYLQGFIHPRWLFGISSINSMLFSPEG